MNTIKEIVGKNLKLYRKAKKLTQEQLAKEIGLNLQHLTKIERGKSFVTAETLSKICSVLNISPMELFNDNLNANSITTLSQNEQLKQLINNIEKIADDDSKLEFMNFAYQSMSNEEALNKLKLILMGFEMKTAINK